MANKKENIPWYDEKEMMFHKARIGTTGIFAQIEKFAKQEPADYSEPIDFESIEKHWNEITEDDKKQGVFDPFDNPYLTPKNRENINKAMIEYQKSQEFKPAAAKKSINMEWTNPKKKIDKTYSRSKYHK